MNEHPRFGTPARKRLVIWGTFIAAILLSIMPGPGWLEPFRPDWVSLVLIYWCLSTPERVGVGTGWLLGFALDLLYGSLLGQHALAKTLLAFVTLKLHLQIRMFPRWQQAVTVFILVWATHLIVLWIRGATGHGNASWAYWVPSVISALIWPWLFLALRELRREANIH